MRQKAEALYLAADEFGRMLGAHVVRHLPVANGQIDYNTMLDRFIADPPSKAAGGPETMEMLVRIYFPEIQTQLSTLLSARDRLSRVVSLHKQAWKDGVGVGPEWIEEFVSAGKEIDLAVKGLQEGIVTSGRSYARWNLRPKTKAQ